MKNVTGNDDFSIWDLFWAASVDGADLHHHAWTETCVRIHDPSTRMLSLQWNLRHYYWSGMCGYKYKNGVTASRNLLSGHLEVFWYFSRTNSPAEDYQEDEKIQPCPRILWKQFRGRVAFLNWNFEQNPRPTLGFCARNFTMSHDGLTIDYTTKYYQIYSMYCISSG